MEYKVIICGGTFDRLHAGHKAFLRFAFSKGEKVIIGVTSDTYIAKYKTSESILPFDKRKKELEKFLEEENLLEKAHIVAINNKFDQTQIQNNENTALLVSSETYPTGLEINKEREKNGLTPLPLLVMPLLTSQTGEKLSSTKIREGLLDREGHFVLDEKITAHPLVVKNSLREILHKPFGTLFMGEMPKDILAHPEKLVTVGDMITQRVHAMHIFPKAAVVDFRVERASRFATLTDIGFSGSETIFYVQNPAGVIMPDVWKLLVDPNFAKAPCVAVVVDGEEDLLVIPLVLLLPLGFTILYGQPGEGVVQIMVTEENKRLLARLLRQYI